MPDLGAQPDSPPAARTGSQGHRLLLLFFDGVGLAPAGDDNPLSTTPMPAVEALLGGPLTAETADRWARQAGAAAGRAGDVGSGRRRVGREEPEGGDGGEVLLRPVDACLGVDGLPQSATGQTTLFTGVNAAAHLGRHVTALPGPRLRALIAEHSLFRRARRRGHRVTFANPFGPGYFRALAERRRRGHSATTWAVLAASLEEGLAGPAAAAALEAFPLDRAEQVLRGVDELVADRAVTWDVTRRRWFEALGPEAALERGLQRVAPQEAGRHLAALAAGHDLTLYETFLTDLAGHFRWGLEAPEVLSRLDGLLAGLLAHRPADLTVVLTSDHGNVEAAAHKRHTRNPVPLLAVGPGARRFAQVDSLTAVTPALLRVLA